jgi:hypothetical protein
MALSQRDKVNIRRALCDRVASARVIAVIDGGASAALSLKVERAINTAHASKTNAAALIANLESGTAMSTASKRALGRVLGRYAPDVANIATDVDALS